MPGRTIHISCGNFQRLRRRQPCYGHTEQGTGCIIQPDRGMAKFNGGRINPTPCSPLEYQSDIGTGLVLYWPHLNPLLHHHSDQVVKGILASMNFALIIYRELCLRHLRENRRSSTIQIIGAGKFASSGFICQKRRTGNLVLVPMVVLDVILPPSLSQQSPSLYMYWGYSASKCLDQQVMISERHNARSLHST